MDAEEDKSTEFPGNRNVIKRLRLSRRSSLFKYDQDL